MITYSNNVTVEFENEISSRLELPSNDTSKHVWKRVHYNLKITYQGDFWIVPFTIVFSGEIIEPDEESYYRWFRHRNEKQPIESNFPDEVNTIINGLNSVSSCDKFINEFPKAYEYFDE